MSSSSGTALAGTLRRAVAHQRCRTGDTAMWVDTTRRSARQRWGRGRLELMVPGRSTERSYQSASTVHTVEVHLSRASVERAAAPLGGSGPDFEAIAAGLAAGDPLVEQIMRSLPSAGAAGDLYAESAAAFLATHLLTQGREYHIAGPEHAAVRGSIAVMRDRLADPLSLTELAAGVHLSVHHFIRVFREATGQTPHRFLTRLRIVHAQRLLTDTDLTIERVAQRCGFANPGNFSTTFLTHVGVRPSVYRRIS